MGEGYRGEQVSPLMLPSKGAQLNQYKYNPFLIANPTVAVEFSEFNNKNAPLLKKVQAATKPTGLAGKTTQSVVKGYHANWRELL